MSIPLVVCLAWIAGAPSVPQPHQTFVDLDADGRQERVVLQPGHERTVSVWRGRRRIWQGVPRRWRPWKLTVADVDGDGKREIIVGIHKTTRYFPQAHHCLFVYGFDGRAVRPKWLGSSLGRPFVDFAFAQLDDDRAEELVAIETTADGQRQVVVYSWNGFGFTGDHPRGPWRDARLVATRPGEANILADGRRVVVKE